MLTKHLHLVYSHFPLLGCWPLLTAPFDGCHSTVPTHAVHCCGKIFWPSIAPSTRFLKVVVRYFGPALLLPPDSSSSSNKEKQTQSHKRNREGRALTLPSEGKSKEPEVDLPLISEHLLKIALSHYAWSCLFLAI
ncbi:hypothetical protein B0H14DRAFT_2627196 [Mycena olivaceomarginata]|nr:hypothetical protein B0H14DRAFT_2627196 [Mycena olivaceomarginata]